MKYLICLVFVLLMACDSRPQNLALGTLERDRIAHTATVNEVVVALPVSQGSTVEKGTLIVKLDDTIQKALVRKAEADVAQAEANLEKLRNGARVEEVAAAQAKVAGAKASLVESEANYFRSLELIETKAISEATRDKMLADLSILATRDGILDNLPWNLGERVTTGSPLAIVLAGKAPFARVYVPEPYRVKIKVGDELVVRVDGLEEPLTGNLRWISSDPAFTPYYALNQEERSRLMFLAEVQLPDSQAHLPNGVPAQVELP